MPGVISLSGPTFSDINKTQCAIMINEVKYLIMVRRTCCGAIPVVFNKAMFDLNKHYSVSDYIMKQCRQSGTTLGFKHNGTLELHFTIESFTGSYFYISMKSRTCCMVRPEHAEKCVPPPPTVFPIFASARCWLCVDV